MSANFYELMRYAKTGIASPDITSYDKLRALALAGGYSPYTITGIPPLSFKSDGSPLTSVTIKGATVQDGTPTPSDPIPVNGAGERTAQLFNKDGSTVYNAYFNSAGAWLPNDASRCVKIPCSPSTTYSLSISNAIQVFRIYESSDTDAEPSQGVDVYLREVIRSSNISEYTFTTSQNAKFLVFQGSFSDFDSWMGSLMLNSGSSPLPYEPYGYKVPVTCGGQTKTFYIGANPLRKSLDGTAVDVLDSAAGTVTIAVDSDGTPLAETYTVQITAPEIPTAKGSNTLTVDTTVQPSEISITGNIKPEI